MTRILALDWGNHALKAALFADGAIVRRWMDPGADAGTVERILTVSAPDGIAFSSVVPERTAVLRTVLEGRHLLHVLEAGPGITLPFRLLVRRPEHLGPDRLCAACGAAHAGFREAVIVDAGTAVTVDLLTDEGFHGGSIFPGIGLLLDSLHAGTAELPRIEPEGGVSTPPGKDTGEALRCGAYWGFIGAVRELVSRTAGEDYSGGLLVTGGAGAIIAPHLEGEVELYPDLVTEGLYYCYRLAMTSHENDRNAE